MSSDKFCCDVMEYYVKEDVIRYDEAIDQYSLVIERGAEIELLQMIDFCPWSGTKLPLSWGDKWRDELEKLGIDPMKDPIPEAYKTAAWRTAKA